MNRQTVSEENAQCLRAIANALTTDQGLITFVRKLAPQWGSSTGKTRSYSGFNRPETVRPRCIVRINSRTAILLNDALYRHEGPSKLAAHLADALRHPQVDATGAKCTIRAGHMMEPIEIRIDQYSDAEGNEVAPDSQAFHHRVVSIVPA
jgi:hypothetical protein